MITASGARISEMNWDVENIRTDPAWVVAVELDDEAGDCVEQHVDPERAARIRTSATLGRQKHGQDQRLGAGFV